MTVAQHLAKLKMALLAQELPLLPSAFANQYVVMDTIQANSNNAMMVTTKMVMAVQAFARLNQGIPALLKEVHTAILLAETAKKLEMKNATMEMMNQMMDAHTAQLMLDTIVQVDLVIRLILADYLVMGKFPHMALLKNAGNLPIISILQIILKYSLQQIKQMLTVDRLAQTQIVI